MIRKNKIFITIILIGFLALLFWISLRIYHYYCPQITSISYLVSKADVLKYCNGVDMNSNGYRKTMTKLVTDSILPTRLSKEALINKTIALASGKNNVIVTEFERNKQKLITLKGDTAVVSHIEPWAGISIFMCSWKPLVEVNLLRFPEIKKVVWQSD